MFNKIDKVLKKQLNKVSLGEVAQAAYVCHVANEYFIHLRGESSPTPRRCGLVKALSFRDGTLEVGVANNIEAMKIQANKMQIIDEINKELKSKKIERIKYKILS